MTADQLLNEVETLPYGKRVKRMVDFGRLAAAKSPADPSIAAVLQSLQAGGSFERRLALLACLGSRDTTTVLAAIDDPSCLTRALALSIARLVCGDAELVRLLDGAKRAMRLSVIRGLLKQRRRNVIDAFVEAAATQDERGWAEFLPYATASLVARHADAFAAMAPMQYWKRLARHHPALCAGLLTRQADAAPGLDARILHHAVSGIRMPTPARRHFPR